MSPTALPWEPSKKRIQPQRGLRPGSTFGGTALRFDRLWFSPQGRPAAGQPWAGGRNPVGIYTPRGKKWHIPLDRGAGRTPRAYDSKFLCNSRSSIPTGLRPPAQGWPAAGLPWGLNQSGSSRNAVPPKVDPGRNPRWGWILFFDRSQGSSFLATLGCRA